MPANIIGRVRGYGPRGSGKQGAARASRDRLLRVEEPRDRGDQPGQRVAVHGLGAAEVVDHLRRGHPGDRVAFAVRQLQIRYRRPIAVASLRLPQVHPYTISTYPLMKSSDTPDLVCLHEFAVWASLQASYQHHRSALPRNVPTNCGSRVRTCRNRLQHSMIDCIPVSVVAASTSGIRLPACLSLDETRPLARRPAARSAGRRRR